jgi:hypothetical protein
VEQERAATRRIGASRWQRQHRLSFGLALLVFFHKGELHGGMRYAAHAHGE